MTLRKITGLLLLLLGTCSFVSGGYIITGKNAITQTTAALPPLEYQKQATNNINYVKLDRHGWFVLIGLISMTAGGYLCRSYKSEVPRITLDFRDQKKKSSDLTMQKMTQNCEPVKDKT